MKSVLMGRRQGKENWELIAGPNVTTSDQIVIRSSFMEKHPINDTWAEVELWNESPVKSRVKFITSDQSKDVADLRDKDEATLTGARDEAEKRQSERDAATAKAAREAHEKEVAELNKQHDAMREGFAPVSKAARKILDARAEPETKNA